MAKFVLKHPLLDIDGTQLEDHASSLEITSEYDEVEFTSFCSDFKEYGQGLGDVTWTIEFYQDFAAAEVDAVLWPLSQSGGTFRVAASGGSEAVSATNPMFEMNGARIFSYSPLAGAVGEASTTSVVLRNAGTGMTRQTGGAV